MWFYINDEERQNMKKVLSLLVCLTLILLFSSTSKVSTVLADSEDTPDVDIVTDDPKEYNILFVGNSLTLRNDMINIFGQIAKAQGKNVNVSQVAKDSYYLHQFAFASNVYGKQLRARLAERKWDYVVVQAQTAELISRYDTTSHGAAATLTDLINENGAQPVFYMTWGLKDGYSYTMDNKTYSYTCEEMAEALSDVYYKIGNEFGALVAPVGQNFLMTEKVYPEINLYKDDGKHPTFAGSYLAAGTIFQTIFDESFLGNSYHDTDIDSVGISEANAYKLQSVADIRMESDKNYILLNTNAKSSFKAKVTVSETNDLFNDNYTGDVTYRTLNKNIVTVDSVTGKITAVGPGVGYVRAETDSGKSILCSVDVRQQAASIELNKEKATIMRAGTLQLSATISPADTTDKTVKWFSTDTTVATVTAGGLVKTKKPGVCKIIASTHNGHTASCEITVNLVTAKNLTVTKAASVKGNLYTDYVLKWTAVKYATQYYVLRSRTINGTYSRIATVTTNSYTNENLKRGIKYYYKIIASSGDELTDADACDAVGIMVPAKVAMKKITVNAPNQTVKIRWTKQKYVTGYRVYRATSKTGKYKCIKNIKNNKTVSYIDSKIKGKRTYYYKVRSYIKINGKTIYGNYSNIKKISTPVF